ncbi:MAG: Xaa-Pro dipeptidase [Pseudomonadota bacterium]
MSVVEPPPNALYTAHLLQVIAAYDEALDAAGADMAVIYSGGLRMAFLDDRPYPFVVNPQFKYWAPITQVPDSYVIYKPGQTPILAYCQPDDFWHAVPQAPDPYWAHHFDVRSIRTPAEAKSLLPQAKAPIFIGDVGDTALALGIERHNPSAALHVLDIARITKTPYELERLRAASRLGAIAHEAAASAFAGGGVSEFDLHQAYLSSIRAIDDELPYNSIVALNEHAAVLHYQHRERVAPGESRTFLIDAGAQAAGYASDITRTYSTDDGAFNDLITAMDRLQQNLCDEVVSGADYRELHQRMHTLLAGVLTDTGIGKGSTEGLIESGITRVFLPHGMGHYLGLQVHDVGGHLLDAQGTPTERPEQDPALRLTRSLAENEVLTVEPGLYFIPMLLDPLRESPNKDLLNWQKVDALTPYGGIRIEDNVRVLHDGHENLTRDAFAAL